MRAGGRTNVNLFLGCLIYGCVVQADNRPARQSLAVNDEWIGAASAPAGLGVPPPWERRGKAETTQRSSPPAEPLSIDDSITKFSSKLRCGLLPKRENIRAVMSLLPRVSLPLPFFHSPGTGFKSARKTVRLPPPPPSRPLALWLALSLSLSSLSLSP